MPNASSPVTTIVRDVLNGTGDGVSAHDAKLYRELEELARYIHRVKSEVAAVRPADIRDEHIATATDELDAVVGATEKATFAIFDACDVVGAVAGAVDAENAGKLNDAVTRIYEACNFQDITGQRITKVVKALKHIEAKVDALVAALGEETFRAPDPAPTADDDPDKALLHGPQSEAQATSQDEIDRLLASFD
ncbi:protein phosphatase CheZ [Azospirillum sp. sgz301742]